MAYSIKNMYKIHALTTTQAGRRADNGTFYASYQTAYDLARKYASDIKKGAPMVIYRAITIVRATAPIVPPIETLTLHEGGNEIIHPDWEPNMISIPTWQSPARRNQR